MSYTKNHFVVWDFPVFVNLLIQKYCWSNWSRRVKFLLRRVNSRFSSNNRKQIEWTSPGTFLKVVFDVNFIERLDISGGEFPSRLIGKGHNKQRFRGDVLLRNQVNDTFNDVKVLPLPGPAIIRRGPSVARIAESWCSLASLLKPCRVACALSIS